jgi:ubiquinone/menaquinone biosynthesis C-methylase UbiE
MAEKALAAAVEMALEAWLRHDKRIGSVSRIGMLESDIYERRYANFDQRNAIWKVLAEQFFQRFVDPNDEVVDIACGYGWFINHITARKKYAVDINEDAKKHLAPDVTFLLGSSSHIALPDASVDKVYVGNLFEHLTRAQIVETINEFHRVLRPGGAAMVLQPNIRFLPHDYWMFFDHITPIDDRALDEVFAINGFELTYKALKFLPHSTRSRWPLGHLVVRAYLALPMVWKLLGKSSFMIYRRV